MNWIRPAKRLAIYLRDGLACVWCGDGIDDAATLTLDHCKPYSKGGNNEAANLLTCCAQCNRLRGARTLTAFAADVAGYIAADAADVLRFTRTVRARVINVDEAKTLIARRGGFVAACRNPR